MREVTERDCREATRSSADVGVLVAPKFLRQGAPPGALDHAIAIVDAERFLGLFHEATVQRFFLDLPMPSSGPRLAHHPRANERANGRALRSDTVFKYS